MNDLSRASLHARRILGFASLSAMAVMMAAPVAAMEIPTEPPRQISGQRHPQQPHHNRDHSDHDAGAHDITQRAFGHPFEQRAELGVGWFDLTQ